MSGPLWLHAALASLMIAIAADCAIQLGLVRLGLVRLRRVWLRRAVFDVDGLHVLMGVAMAGMLLPQLRFLPTPAWEAVFGVGALWFGWRTIATGGSGSRSSGALGRLAGGAPQAPHAPQAPQAPLTPHVPLTPLAHVIECLAMVFMFLPALDEAVGRSHPAGQAMAGMSRTGLVTLAPAVALLLALCLVGYVVWTTDTLARSRSFAPAGVIAEPAGATAAVAGAAPRLAAFSAIAMALTMGYMLIQMA